MKKKVKIVIIILLIVVLAVCAWFIGYHTRKSQDNLPSLESIAEMDEADINDLLVGYRNYFDSHYLVEPVEGSPELRSSDRIDVKIEHLDLSLEPEVGDIIEIIHSGEIMESDPARLQDVYSIRVVKEEAQEQWDLIPMVMVDGKLYLDTGMESSVEARCGVMDGEITSSVDGTKKPTQDGESNFGTGYGYQYGPQEGTIEIFMNEKWWVFATEDVRQEIQFPESNNE